MIRAAKWIVIAALGLLRFALGVFCVRCFTRIDLGQGPQWWCRGARCKALREAPRLGDRS